MDKLKQAIESGEIMPYRISPTTVELRGSPEKLAELCEYLIVHDCWEVHADEHSEIRICFPGFRHSDEDLPNN